MTSAEEYRRLARECLVAARSFPDGERRTTLLQMAQVWQRLADEQADATQPFVETPPRTTEPAQPPAQQQQQIQPKDEDKD
jgi:hypothetical protein